MNGLITVIVPVYNAAAYLPRCLGSLTEQTWERLEILLVDDGSCDDSLAVCRRWAERDERIRVLHQENGGVSRARNLGMEEAKGDYITFVDADDWIEPKMLETLAACLKQDQSDMALCAFREVRERQEGAPDCVQMGQTQDAPAQDATAQDVPAQEVLPQDVSAHRVLDAQEYAGQVLLNSTTHCWAVLFARSLAGSIRFREGLTIGEDLLFLADLLPGLRRVSILDEPMYCYYINEKGAMFSGFRASYMDQITCWELARERIGALYPQLLPKIDASLFMAAMLTAGKLSALPPKEWRGSAAGWLKSCRQAASASWKRLAGHRSLLSAGYRIKGLLFGAAPYLYLRLYHISRR